MNLLGKPLLSAVAAVAFALGGARNAHAQQLPSVTGIAGAVQVVAPDQSDAGSLDPINAIDRAACDSDLEYRFELLISNPSTSYNLNVWAGSQDCSILANRQAATAVCWPVFPPVLATANPFAAVVRMQDIVSQVADSAHDVAYSPATSNVCSSAIPEGTELSLYFFFTDVEGNAVGTTQPYPITVDLAGAPDGGLGSTADASTSEGNGSSGSSSGGCAVQSGPATSDGGLVALGIAGVLAGARGVRAKRRRRGV